MNIKWDYNNRTCDISIDGYVKKQLEKFKHTSTKKQHSPSKYVPPKYGQKIQMAEKLPKQNVLTPKEINQLQQVIGSFLFYGRVVDCTMIHALNSLAAAQSEGLEETKKAMTHFLNYCDSPYMLDIFHSILRVI